MPTQLFHHTALLRPQVLTLGLAVMCSLLASCATQTLSAATSLAKSGQSAALQMTDNAQISADSMTALKRAVAFNTGYNKGSGARSSQDMLAHIVSIQAKLGQYSKLLTCLSASYSALGDLAAYDGAGSFNTAVQSFSTEGDAFFAAIGSKTKIPTSVAAGVGAIGGVAISELQARRVKRANGEIEDGLKAVILVLDDPETRSKLVPVADQVSGQISQSAVVLLADGVFSFDAMVDALGAPMALKSTSASDDAIAKDPNARAGLMQVAVAMANEQSAAAASSYDKSLALLKALIPLHDALAASAPLNLDQIKAATTQLRTTAASLQAATPATPSGK